MGKFLRIVGWLWIIAAVVVMLIGYAATWMFQGFSKFMDVLPGPHNVIGLAVTLLTLVPGIGLVLLGNRIEARRDRTPNAIPPS